MIIDVPGGLEDINKTELALPAAGRNGGSEEVVPLDPSLVTVEMAIEVLLRTAQQDPQIQLLPWLEREFTLHALKMTQGNQVRASKLLGITRATLRKRIEQFGITKELTIS